MANSLTTKDVYAIINAAAVEMWGKDNTLVAHDTTSFVAVGEQMLRQGFEPTYKALSQVVGKTVIDVRPYKGQYHIIAGFNDVNGMFSRKISFFTKIAEPSQNVYTDLYNASTNKQLDDGESIDHYKISKKYPVETWFSGVKSLQYHYTTFRNQIRIAFTNEANFAEFISGMLVAIANDIAHLKEAENMLTLINYIATLKLDGFAYNLVSEFNKEYGTNYSWSDLQTTYKKDFLEFLVAYLKLKVKNFELDTENFHKIPYQVDDAGNAMTLLRHTPAAKQKLMMYEPFWVKAEATVMPEVFNDQYLKTDNFEKVLYWQNPNNPSGVNCKPNHLAPDAITHKLVSTDALAAVEIPYVLGLLFDEEALKIRYMLDYVNVTPVNAAGDYFNTYYHWLKNYVQDETQNGVLFYAQDSVDVSSTAVGSADATGSIVIDYYGSIASPTIVCSDAKTTAAVSGNKLTITLASGWATGTVTLSGTGADNVVINVTKIS